VTDASAASLGGRVAVVTGAGRGIGREHALLLAAEGARVVVNDLDVEPAEAVAAAIREAGGEAVASPGDVADWDGGQGVVRAALDAFGDLHVLVNNAGIVRDRFLVNMTEQEWDEVVRAHLRGHFVPTRWAATWWREQAKAGRPHKASVVCTSSTSGLLGNPGQTNYGAAKAGVAGFATVASQELAAYGVRVNAIAPMARTRLTESTPGLEAVVRAPTDPGAFDTWHPSNVAPVVAWLASEACTITGKVFFVHGGKVQLFSPWTLTEAVENDGRWTVAALSEAMSALVQ
jgi:NAD(P)-dependent dehydrogenase (short-subunit alcohol dehydrogenase family)